MFSGLMTRDSENPRAQKPIQPPSTPRTRSDLPWRPSRFFAVNVFRVDDSRFRESASAQTHSTAKHAKNAKRSRSAAFAFFAVEVLRKPVNCPAAHQPVSPRGLTSLSLYPQAERRPRNSQYRSPTVSGGYGLGLRARR